MHLLLLKAYQEVHTHQHQQRTQTHTPTRTNTNTRAPGRFSLSPFFRPCSFWPSTDISDASWCFSAVPVLIFSRAWYRLYLCISCVYIFGHDGKHSVLLLVVGMQACNYLFSFSIFFFFYVFIFLGEWSLALFYLIFYLVFPPRTTSPWLVTTGETMAPVSYHDVITEIDNAEFSEN